MSYQSYEQNNSTIENQYFFLIYSIFMMHLPPPSTYLSFLPLTPEVWSRFNDKFAKLHSFLRTYLQLLIQPKTTSTIFTTRMKSKSSIPKSLGVPSIHPVTSTNLELLQSALETTKRFSSFLSPQHATRPLVPSFKMSKNMCPPYQNLGLHCLEQARPSF